MSIATVIDECIICRKELVLWERNRAECFECRERSVESYGDDQLENEEA